MEQCQLCALSVCAAERYEMHMSANGNVHLDLKG